MIPSWLLFFKGNHADGEHTGTGIAVAVDGRTSDGRGTDGEEGSGGGRTLNGNRSWAIVGSDRDGVSDDRTDIVMSFDIDIIEARESGGLRIIDCDGKRTGFCIARIDITGSSTCNRRWSADCYRHRGANGSHIGALGGSWEGNRPFTGPAIVFQCEVGACERVDAAVK